MIRALVFVLVGSVVLAVVGLVVGGRQHGPDYSGGSFTVWLKRAGPDARVDEAVAQEGAVLVPDLVELVEWEPSRSERISRKIYDVLPESWQSSFRLLNVADPEQVRIQALRALGGLGPEAGPVLATVLAWAGIPDETGREALTAALRISPTDSAVTQRVLAGLLDESPAKREQAAQAMVAANVPVEGGLLTLLDSLKTSTRPSAAAVAAIGLYGPKAIRAVPRLAPWLRDEELKRPVLLTLRQIGPASSIALVEVRPELKEKSPVIVEALDLVGIWGPSAARVLSEIKPLEENPAPMIRLLAAAARGKAGVEVPTALKALSQEIEFQIPDYSLSYPPNHPLLRDVRFTPAQTAAWLLGDFGPQGELVAAYLITALQSDDSRLAVIAAWSLWRIGKDAALVVPAIRKGLRFTPDPVTQLIALAAAAELGPVGALLQEELDGIQQVSLPLRQSAKAAQMQIDGKLPVPVRR